MFADLVLDLKIESPYCGNRCGVVFPVKSSNEPSNDVVFKIAHNMAAESWWSIPQMP